MNTRLIDLTAGEFLDLLAQGSKPQVEIDTTQGAKKYVYGLAGIADLFGCSKTTANRIKQSGKIDKAITQVGSLIIVEAEKAIELAGKKNGRSKK